MGAAQPKLVVRGLLRPLLGRPFRHGTRLFALAPEQVAEAVHMDQVKQKKGDFDEAVGVMRDEGFERECFGLPPARVAGGSTPVSFPPRRAPSDEGWRPQML